ncbi:hypothetical protein GCM10009578_026080 [Streptomyces rhizosphaericus]|uniref:Transposase n=1 Tax=Streptomyces rhizosphaericus TaxID=114699 RepID=A0ABN1R3I7_9ACTN
MPSSSAAGCPPASLDGFSEASTVGLVCCHAWPAGSHSQGYDYRHLRRWLAYRGIRHRLARKAIESSPRLGRHQWVVERTNRSHLDSDAKPGIAWVTTRQTS